MEHPISQVAKTCGQVGTVFVAGGAEDAPTFPATNGSRSRNGEERGYSRGAGAERSVGVCAPAKGNFGMVCFNGRRVGVDRELRCCAGKRGVGEPVRTR